MSYCKTITLHLAVLLHSLTTTERSGTQYPSEQIPSFPWASAVTHCRMGEEGVGEDNMHLLWAVVLYRLQTKSGFVCPREWRSMHLLFYEHSVSIRGRGYVCFRRHHSSMSQCLSCIWNTEHQQSCVSQDSWVYKPPKSALGSAHPSPYCLLYLILKCECIWLVAPAVFSNWLQSQYSVVEVDLYPAYLS